MHRPKSDSFTWPCEQETKPFSGIEEADEPAASGLPLAHPGVQQQVVWLDVSVDEAQLVDGVDGQDRLGDVELRGLLGQRVLLHQQGHHVAWQRNVDSQGRLQTPTHCSFFWGLIILRKSRAQEQFSLLSCLKKITKKAIEIFFYFPIGL